MATICSIKDTHKYTSMVYDNLSEKFTDSYRLSESKKPGELNIELEKVSLDDFMISEYSKLVDLFLNKNFDFDESSRRSLKLVSMVPKILSKALDEKLDIISDNTNEKTKQIRFSTALENIGIRMIDVSNSLDYQNQLFESNNEDDYFAYLQDLVVPEVDNDFIDSVNNELVEDVSEVPLTKEEKENEPEVILTNPTSYSFNGQTINDNAVHLDLDIVAVSPTIFSDYQKSIENNLDNKDSFYFKVERELLKGFYDAKNNGNTFKINNEEVFITSINMSELPIEYHGTRTSATKANEEGRIVNVFTNENGDILKFNDDGKYDSDGKVAYMLMPDTQKMIVDRKVKLNFFQESGVKHLSKITGKSLSESREIYNKEIFLLNELRKEILDRKTENNKDNAIRSRLDNSIQFKINGGTMGVLSGNANNTNNVSEIDFGENNIEIFLSKKDVSEKGLEKNKLYLVGVDGTHGQPVRIHTKSIDSAIIYNDVSLADYLTDLMTLDFQKSDKFMIKSIIDNFMFLGPDGFSMIIKENEFKIFFRGNLIEHKTEAGKDFIRSKFSELNIYQEVKSIKGKTVINPKSNYTQDDVDYVVRIKSNNGVKYYNLSKIKYKASSVVGKSSLNKFNIKKINKENGVNTLNNSSLTYYSFVKGNTTTKVNLTMDRKIEKVGAYLTFEPTEETLNKVNATKDEIQKIEKVVEEKLVEKNEVTKSDQIYLSNQITGENGIYSSKDINIKMLKELGYDDVDSNDIMKRACNG